jgi:hypothetical protein
LDQFLSGFERTYTNKYARATRQTSPNDMFFDADHAGDRVTRRSRTGVLLYLNRSPILWYSKKQGSIETSTFGSEFMELKTAVDMVMGMRYKLRMMGIPIDGHTHT